MGEWSNTPFQSARSKGPWQCLRRVEHVEIIRAYKLVMASVKMSSEIVGQVFLARMPSNVEISKFDLLSDPKEILFHRT